MGCHKKHTPEFIEKEAEALDEWINKDENIFFKKFSISRGYPAENMSRWAKENERFAQSYARVKDWQEAKLLEMGLNRKNDPTITKFAMQNVCRWSDKQTVIHETTESAIHPSANNTSPGLLPSDD